MTRINRIEHVEIDDCPGIEWGYKFSKLFQASCNVRLLKSGVPIGQKWQPLGYGKKRNKGVKS